METLGDKMVTNSGAKEQPIYSCDLCEFVCCKKYNLTRHLSSAKHKRVTNGDIKNTAMEELTCEYCNKQYLSRNGLWKHKKKCKPMDTDNVHLDKEMVMMLIKDNTDLKNIIMKSFENANSITNNTNTNTNSYNTTNSHNKAFNLNFFLNETCKHAMNITEFMDSIKLQLSDLMSVGEIGYVDGISKIIIKNLNNLGETERPIHCTDKKRETFYVKDKDKWEKDNEKKHLQKVIRNISNKNIRLLPFFREAHPDYRDSASSTSDNYDKMVIEVMVSDTNKDAKIMKHISNATIISKL